ncbi:hypothetical protein BSZ39_00515 [Bowdeniella nasicola]|uniref:HNH nuclease domain-containing protein n=1 Tax=Bowdeniella nasicola TaxID=208480 RepID=A0A1Q5Q5I8_9ACTO|nr:HNH endonuclease signature motif containing protein [Bowdeniella nasicola]OKL55053.1 hypothetical protein BSZ39_00515 [Bowdeniella nasicola]
MSAVAPLSLPPEAPLSAAELAELAALSYRAAHHGCDAKTRAASIDALVKLEEAGRNLDVVRTRQIAAADAKRTRQEGRTISSVITETRALPTKLADGVVKRAVRQARFPLVLDAVADGQLSAPNAGILVGTLQALEPFCSAEQLADSAAQLIRSGRWASPGFFKAACRDHLDRIDLRGAASRTEHDAKLRKLSQAKRFLTFTGNDTEGYDIRGHATGEQYAIIAPWLARESNRIHRASRHGEGPVPAGATRTIDALTNLARRGNQETPPREPAPSTPAFFDDSAHPKPPAPQKILPASEASPTGTQPPVAEDPRARLVGPQLRAALAKRDCGCVVPWCSVKAELCDGHHLLAYADGGPTTLDNVVLMCPRHHPQFENPPGSRTGWTIRLIDGIAAAIPPARDDPEQAPHYHPRFHTRIARRRQPSGPAP